MRVQSVQFKSLNVERAREYLSIVGEGGERKHKVETGMCVGLYGINNL